MTHPKSRPIDEADANARLLAAANRVWDAYLKYGPVDDGRPEGDEFAAALDALMKATVEAEWRN